ncbi:hypothetical protein BS78_05G031400 [Paspalum vaginatum]|nr:hypothetical protein BS78_05G031400 [Paspalum vaginatum]
MASYSLSPAASHTDAQADGIDPLLPICKTVGGGSRYFGIDFCMSALGSDGRSRTAESYRNLSIIAVDLVTANATATVAKIGGLLKTGGKGDDATKESLESCQALYSGVLDLLPGCAAAIKAGKFDQAALSLERTASAARECDDAFRENNVASPLALEDDSEFKLAKLAVALLGFAS